MHGVLSSTELAFIKQKDLFVERALSECGYASLSDVGDPTSRQPEALKPVIISDYRAISAEEASAMARAFYGECGVVHFATMNPEDKSAQSHALLDIASQLKDVLPLNYPVAHPMEGHPEAVSRFGQADGTLKIYDLDTKDARVGYREQAETSELFAAHNDGLGYAGAVQAFGLYAESAPLWGGYTYFQNIVRLALHLAKVDPEAFESLFLPDAVTALRPRGKGAIEVVTPVLFVGEFGLPQVFFRMPSGEYRITWREGIPALKRARDYLSNHSRPFSNGSSFIHLDRKGLGCFARNQWVVHGRTPFINGKVPDQVRVLARKWFMSAPEHANYKHVPGMHLLDQFAQLYPDRFGPERLSGHWNYDSEAKQNVRKG